MTGAGPGADGDRAAGTGPREPAGDGPDDADQDRAAPSDGPDGGCGAHPGIGAEVRALALLALDRLEPALQRMLAEPPTAPAATSCAGCPVCAVLALLRGERPELAVTVAEQLGGLLAVLRVALEEGDPAASGPPANPADPDPSAPAPGSGRRVQRIPVERVAR